MADLARPFYWEDSIKTGPADSRKLRLEKAYLELKKVFRGHNVRILWCCETP